MPIYTVSQISDAIKKTLEGSFSTIQIKGEISNLRLQSSGHYYFTLKDETAQISCALFRMDAAKLKTPIKDGDQIVASGNISVFTPKGTYQLIVKEIQLQGLGDLLLKFEALKQKFQKQGYFDPSRKKKLPKFPKTIGVITSPTGAVIQDIIQTLTRRHPGFKLLLIPTKVQGEGSSKEIALALDTMNKHELCDVIICGRGGGSIEDLWCFNEEEVVEAIFRSKIPVISAVGHETDFTLADFVADIRAPTPTAAAEMALFDLKEFKDHIVSRYQTISRLISKRIEHDKRVISQIKKRPELTSSSSLLQGFFFSLDRIESRLTTLMEARLARFKSELERKKHEVLQKRPDHELKNQAKKLESIKVKLGHHGRMLIQNQEHKLCFNKKIVKDKMLQFIKDTRSSYTQLKEILYTLHPDNVVDKGYAIIENEEGSKTFTSVFDLNEKDNIRLKMKDGSCLVHVKSKSLI
jgi:exodeoxyribonuclease VII large subunit